MTLALHSDITQLKSQIEETERAIAEARQQADTLEDDLGQGVAEVSEKLAGRAVGSDHLYLDLDADLVAKLALELLEGYEATEPAEAGPAATWKLHGLKIRPHRGRIFVSGGYSVKVGGGECEGPINGHLFYLQKNLLRLAKMEIHCKASGHKVALNVAERIEGIPVPFDVRETIPLTVRKGVSAPAKSLTVLTPVQVELGVEHVGVRSRATTVRRDDS